MRTHHIGFTLIELMIAVTLGLLAVAAVGSVFIAGSRNYKQDDKISRMQDELRFAMAQLTHDIEMAGFWAQIRNPAQDITVHPSATVSTDCGPTTDGAAATAGNNWVYNERRAALATRGNATPSQANASFPCINTGEFMAGTDILAIKRLGNEVTSVTDEQNGRVFLRTNGVQSVIYRQTGATSSAVHPRTLTPTPAGDNVTVYEYRPAVWYIRKFAVDQQNPPVPSLCRESLAKYGAAPRMEVECLAQGIADMQLEFGVDSDADGVPDFFVEYDAAQAPESVLSRIVAVRVHLLARSSESDVGYVNEKTYQLASQSRGPFNDGFYRRALSTTVPLRNPINRLIPYSLPSG